MRKKIVICIILSALIYLIPISIFAEDIVCEYGNGVNIYYKNGNVSYDYDKLTNEWYSMGIILWDARNDKYLSDEIEIENQEELKKAFGNYFCPQTVYLCEVTNWGIELPSVYTVLGDIGYVIAGVVDIFSLGNIKIYDWYENNIWTLAHINKKNLYIMGQEGYEDNYKSLDGTAYFTHIFYENWEDAGDWCTWFDGVDVGEAVVDGICGTIWSIVGTVEDLINSDDKLLLGVTDTTCHKYDYPEDGEYIPMNLSCKNADKNMLLLDRYLEDYKSCSSTDCKIEAKEKIDEKFKKLEKQCDGILQSYSYEGAEKECIEKCLSLSSKMLEIEETTPVVGQCGFSGNLIMFIANIIRWGKYIVPVIVIVLGILDFIKSIVSDKDDDMKKGQSKFIKRLIAAALIFITPLIVEFILIKLGFNVTTCGIINL